jgi:hypothetical protein
MTELTQELLKEILTYDSNTGIFYRNRTNKIAGSIDKNGYILIYLNKKIYKAHRLVWLYEFGVWPKDQIDHINGNRTDNRFCNLRECTTGQNNQNTALYKNNTSGYMGVYFIKSHKKWAALIRFNRKRIYIGRFATPELAYDAYLEAKKKLHTFNPIPR